MFEAVFSALLVTFKLHRNKNSFEFRSEIDYFFNARLSSFNFDENNIYMHIM